MPESLIEKIIATENQPLPRAVVSLQEIINLAPDDQKESTREIAATILTSRLNTKHENSAFRPRSPQR